MKIMFVYVNSYNRTGIPIGPSYLISMLKNLGHRVCLFETTFYEFNYTDFNLGADIGEEGREIIADFKSFKQQARPDLIAVSCDSLCLNFAVKMLECLPEKPAVIFGGVGPTVDYMNLIRNEVVDYVCVGYGEECLMRLVESLEKNSGPEAVPNLIYKNNGRIIENSFSQRIDLSKLPVPDWSLFDKRHFERIFKGEVKRWGNFQLTRGCPFSCSYCINYHYHKNLGIKIARFPAEKIIEEIKLLSGENSLEIVRIFDECFGFGGASPMKEFAEMYKREISLPSIIETRPEAITPEMMQVLKDINCISVSIGIEAGNEQQRRTTLNRFVANDVIRRAFELLRRAGIRTSSYNIIGFPDDTREKIFETIRLNRECNTDFINLFLFSPSPKTRLKEYCRENNLLETDATVDYARTSIVKNTNMGKDELYGLFRTFEHYIKFPEYLYPLIERAEKFDQTGNSIYELLTQIKQANHK